MMLGIDPFGCPTCLPPSPDDAWSAVPTLHIDSRLVDESHFSVLLRSCSSCSQRFVSVFTEIVDWAEGEDPQFWTVLPITEKEATALRAADEQGVALQVYELGSDRRSLCHSFPKSGGAMNFWSKGIQERPHE
jgi:hypothetical protein